MDPHTFFMDHDPAVFLNADLDLSGFADPDPALKLCKKSPNKEFLSVGEKTQNRLLISIFKKHGAGLNFFNKTTIITNFFFFFLLLFLHFSIVDLDPGWKMNADPDPQPCCAPCPPT